MSDRLPTCSVVVCTRNRPGLLDRCLEALTRQDYGTYEIVVVDNAPSDHQAEAVATRRRARYLIEPRVGLSHARNTGARACSSEIVLFTDDDAVPDPTWVSCLVRPFTDPGVAAVAGRTVPLIDAGTLGAPPEHASDPGPASIRAHKGHRHWFEMAHFGGIGIGNNMSFRRELFDRWSGFDVRLGRGAPVASGEEHRAFAELIELGYTVVYDPDAIVRHPVPLTLHALREQHLRSRSDLAAYAVFLFLETGHRWGVARYVAEAAFGVRRRWRFQTGVVPADFVSKRDVVRACAQGAWSSVMASVRGRRWRGASRHDTRHRTGSTEASAIPLRSD